MNPGRREDSIDVSVDVTRYDLDILSKDIEESIEEAPVHELTVEENGFDLDISENAVSWEIAEYADMHTSDLPLYRGPTEFVPTQQPQHVYVGGKAVRSDILIKPIPENYGLITYDGATLTVS